MQRARASFVVILLHQKIEMPQNEEIEKTCKLSNRMKKSEEKKFVSTEVKATPISV